MVEAARSCPGCGKPISKYTRTCVSCGWKEPADAAEAPEWNVRQSWSADNVNSDHSAMAPPTEVEPRIEVESHAEVEAAGAASVPAPRDDPAPLTGLAVVLSPPASKPLFAHEPARPAYPVRQNTHERSVPGTSPYNVPVPPPTRPANVLAPALRASAIHQDTRSKS